MILAYLLAAILCGVLYRRGGTSAGTLWRDLGVSTLVTLMMVLTFGWNWWLFLSWGLLYAALTNYNDWIKNAKLQWIITGCSYGLAILPFAISIHHIPGCLIRTVFLGGSICWLRLWNKPIWKWSSDIVVEFGCGLLIGISLLLF